MGKVAIVTDSNSGITQAEGKKMGIYVLPMPFYINEELFYEDITLTQEEFYEKLAGDADIKTSQPAPGDVMDMWDKALEEYDEVVHIPMSAGLSSSCETAIMLSQDYDGKVQVVNNHRISVTQRRSVEEAKKLADAGKSAAEIKELLEAIQWDSDIYITVDTLKYLKECKRYYDYKEKQRPIIEANKEYEKKKRKFLQEVKMSKEPPTKKQLYYYERLCKKYDIEKIELKSKLEARNTIDKIITDHQTDYKIEVESETDELC